MRVKGKYTIFEINKSIKWDGKNKPPLKTINILIGLNFPIKHKNISTF